MNSNDNFNNQKSKFSNNNNNIYHNLEFKYQYKRPVSKIAYEKINYNNGYYKKY